MVIPKNLYSKESKTKKKKYHLGILLNTQSAHIPLTYETMHEPMENMSKYMLKSHLGPTQTKTNIMRQSPINKIKKF